MGKSRWQDPSIFQVLDGPKAQLLTPPIFSSHTHEDHCSLRILRDLLQQLQLVLGLGAGNTCRWSWGW